jgi:hypothetical protein
VHHLEAKDVRLEVDEPTASGCMLVQGQFISIGLPSQVLRVKERPLAT